MRMQGLIAICAACFATAFAAFTAPGAQAADAEALRLREHITNFVREQTRGEITRVETPSLSRFEVDAASEDVRVELAASGRSSRPDRLGVRISLWDEAEGRLLRRGFVNVDIHGERSVVVASKALRPGMLIARSDLEIERLPLSEVDPDAVDDPDVLIGQRLRRAVGRGALVQSDFVERPPIVERGQRVKIRVARGPLRIEMIGRAQQEGHVGDWIRATNDNSNRNVIGRIGEDGVLHVDL